MCLMVERSVPGQYTPLREAYAETMSPPNRLVAPALTGLLWPGNASSKPHHDLVDICDLYLLDENRGLVYLLL